MVHGGTCTATRSSGQPAEVHVQNAARDEAQEGQQGQEGGGGGCGESSIERFSQHAGRRSGAGGGGKSRAAEAKRLKADSKAREKAARKATREEKRKKKEQQQAARDAKRAERDAALKADVMVIIRATIWLARPPDQGVV
jgi:hypothetical protein